MTGNYYAIMHPSVEKIWREAEARDLWRHAWRGYRVARRELVSGYLQPRTVLERFGATTLARGEIGTIEGLRFIDAGFRFIPHKGEIDMTTEHQGTTVTTDQAHRAVARIDDALQRRRFHHDLKSTTESFSAVLDGIKRHEIRRADRTFTEGDTLTLHEFIPDGGMDTDGHTTGRMTGRQWHGMIGHVSAPLTWGLPASLCCFTVIERFA